MKKSLELKAKHACFNNDLSQLKNLHKKGADIHYDNEICLRTACTHGNLKTVQYLVENGAKIHGQYEYDSLFLSYLAGQYSVIEYLVKYVKDGNDIAELFIINIARDNKYLPIFQYLVLEKGLNINMVIKDDEITKDTLEWALKYKNSKDLNDQLDIGLNNQSRNHNRKKI